MVAIKARIVMSPGVGNSLRGVVPLDGVVLNGPLVILHGGVE